MRPGSQPCSGNIAALMPRPTTMKAKPTCTAVAVAQRGEARGHVGHVERAGGGIEEADADHVEGRADRPHDRGS